MLGIVPDEAEFKTKFPFNLEKEEEPAPKQVPKPPTPKKTPYDIAREKYEKELKKLQDSYSQNLQYIEMIMENINKEDLISSLERPIEVDPLRKLAQIFSQENDDSQLQNETANASLLLNLDFYVEMEDEYKRRFKYGRIVDGTSPDVNTSPDLEKAEEFHRKALFDAFNQALDIERPYKDKGRPAPWSKQTRVTKQKITEAQLDKVLQKAKERVLAWCKTGAGTRLAPLPPPPQNNPDDPSGHQTKEQPLAPEEERINAVRETRLGLLMMRDLDENEGKWIDYEDEDTQIKFDLADMVLDMLASELAGFLHGKSSKK